jgi:hypothetical protein
MLTLARKDKNMPTIETRIAESIIDAALSLDYAITVMDEEETLLHRGVAREAILAQLRHSEYNVLWFMKAGQKRGVGFVQLIWGNEDDLISDSSCNDEVERIIREANKLRMKR